jgi:Holliday junction resolvase RusA-like endonuclease
MTSHEMDVLSRRIDNHMYLRPKDIDGLRDLISSSIMNGTIDLEVKGLPPMANGSHGSWQVKNALRKYWKTQVGLMLLGKTPKVPHKKVKVVFTRYSSVEPDYDGLVHGFKPVRDALVQYGVVEDDKSSNMQAEYKWIRAGRRDGKIRVEITPIPE